MMKSEKVPQFLYFFALFLAPIIGGQLNIGPRPLSGPWLTELITPNLPITAHAIVGMIFIVSLCYVFFVRKVVQVLPFSFLCSFGFFFAILILSVAFSSFKSLSLVTCLEWLSYGVAMLASVALLGRNLGPKIALSVIGASCTLVAIYGILEYGQMRAIDPTWRIFSFWVQSNALGGMLALGFFSLLVIALICSDRLQALLAYSGVVLIGLALLLTQSRGTWLSVIVGLVTLAILLASFKQSKKLTGLLVPIGILAVMFVGLQASTKPAGGAASPSKVALSRTGDATTSHSEQFRKLLWKGTFELIKENPIGYGLGTFRYEGTRSGLTAPTHFAHQGYLQIGFEAGVAGLLAFLIFGGFWFKKVLSGARSLNDNRAILLAGVLSAVVACGVGNLFDSQWQHFGIGIVFFALLGIGLQLAVDGGTPEFIPQSTRTTFVAIYSAILLILNQRAMVSEMAKSDATTAIALQQTERAIESASRAISINPTDGEAYALRAQVDRNTMESDLAKASELSPSPRNWRAMARLAALKQNDEGVKYALSQAAIRDPNNLLALGYGVSYFATAHPELQSPSRESDESIAALDYLKQMWAVRESPYFTVRAVPELVPTEIALAELEYCQMPAVSADQRVSILTNTLATLRQYSQITKPRIEQLGPGPDGFAGETLADCAETMLKGLKTIELLAASYRALGEPSKAAEVEGFASEFAPPKGI